MKIFMCEFCGHLEFNEIPQKCPVCGFEKEKFTQNDRIFQESQAKSPEAEVKHVPAVQVNKECGLIPETRCMDILVRIGNTLHPMEDKHFIQFIDCYQNDTYIGRAQFSPGLYPAAFNVIYANRTRAISCFNDSQEFCWTICESNGNINLS